MVSETEPFEDGGYYHIKVKANETTYQAFITKAFSSEGKRIKGDETEGKMFATDISFDEAIGGELILPRKNTSLNAKKINMTNKAIHCLCMGAVFHASVRLGFASNK